MFHSKESTIRLLEREKGEVGLCNSVGCWEGDRILSVGENDCCCADQRKYPV